MRIFGGESESESSSHSRRRGEVRGEEGAEDDKFEAEELFQKQGFKIRQLEVRAEDTEAELCRRSLTILGLPQWRHTWETDEKPNAPEEAVENSDWSLMKMINTKAPRLVDKVRLVFGKWCAGILFKQEKSS